MLWSGVCLSQVIVLLKQSNGSKFFFQYKGCHSISYTSYRQIWVSPKITALLSQIFTFMQMILSCLGIWPYISNSLDQYYLQSGINKVGDWAKEWLLKLNAEKCCGMSFAANISNVCTTKYYTEEDKILHEIVKLEPFKDLGVIFDSKLNFGEHIKEKSIRHSVF